MALGAVAAGPAEGVGHWRHVSTAFWEFSAIFKNMRQRSVGQTVQKIQQIPFWSPFGPKNSTMNIEVWIISSNTIVFYNQ